jgi:N-acetylneuraminic acid mutarotase
LPEPRCGYGLAVLGGRVYVFGGRDGDDPATAADDVWHYGPQDDSWVPAAPLPLPRADLAAVAVGDCHIHLLGGRDRSGEAQANNWVFNTCDPASPWRLDDAPALPQPRAGHVAAAPSESRIYVVGGGWDVRVEPPVVELNLSPPEGDPEWRAYTDVPGFTPQRGAAMVARSEESGVVLDLAGGRAGGQLLDQYRFIRVLWQVYVGAPRR